MRQAYRYPNGSQIVVGGLDKPGKVMSTEYDAIYVCEAIELAEEAWEALTTRLRNYVLPYQQLLADTNPDRPTHWLKKRADTGRVLMLESRHDDNPRLWDGKDWTAEGCDYIAKLDALTGPRKQRLRYGRWVQAEGVVYDGWDAAIHIVDRFAVPPNWPRFLSVDFGFTNPFVCQWWGMDPDGRLYLYREIYHTRRLVEDHARRILELSCGEPAPLAIVCDHDAEGRATLERDPGMATTPAVKGAGQKTPGIESVARRLRRAADGYPRLFILRDSLDERDPELVAAKKPGCTAEEFDSYVWDTRGNRARGEVPVKVDDHGCFVAGTMIACEFGWLPIEQIAPGDKVLTRSGFRRVLAAGCTSPSAVVSTLILSDGRRLTGTPNHPVFVNATDFERMDALRYGDCPVDVMENPTWKSFLCRQNDPVWSAFALTELSTGATQTPRGCRIATTSAVESPTKSEGSAPYTETFGPFIENAKRESGEPHVLAVIEEWRQQPVFNLTVEGEHEYYANGVLVHNCDATRYLVWGIDCLDGVADDDVEQWDTIRV